MEIPDLSGEIDAAAAPPVSSFFPSPPRTFSPRFLLAKRRKFMSETFSPAPKEPWNARSRVTLRDLPPVAPRRAFDVA